jgi:signal peptidase II
MIDRIFLGYVVDFLEFTFIDFPVFNVADICVVFGAIIMIVYALFFDKTFFVDQKKPTPVSASTEEDSNHDGTDQENLNDGN